MEQYFRIYSRNNIRWFCRRNWRKLGHQIFCSSYHRFEKMSMLLSSHWGGTSFYPIIYEIYLSWKIRVSLSNPRSTRRNILENISSKHKIEAISLVKWEVADPKGDEDKAQEIIYQTNKDNYLNCLSCICCVLCMIECFH